MIRIHWKRTAAFIALLGFAASVHFSIWSNRPGVTASNYSRLELGMTQSQVEEFLGGPPSLLAPNGRNWLGLMELWGKSGHTRVVWAGNDAAIMLSFDEHGQITDKSWFDAEDSVWGRLRRYWLGG